MGTPPRKLMAGWDQVIQVKDPGSGHTSRLPARALRTRFQPGGQGRATTRRVRVASVCAVFAILSGCSWSGWADNDRLLVDGFAAILDHDQKRARDHFHEYELLVPEGAQTRVVLELADIWELHPDRHARTRFGFDWLRAAELLRVVATDDQMPAEVRRWAQGEIGGVLRGWEALRSYREAESLMKVADSRFFEGQHDLAQVGYIKACKVLVQEIPSHSAFQVPCTRMLARVKRKIVRGLEASAHELLWNDTPPWPDIRELFLLAAEYTADENEKLRLVSRAEQMLREDEAEALYIDAYGLVELRQTGEYERAKALLRGIPADTRLYDQSQYLLEWLHAETLSRQATEAYRNGEAEEALRLTEKFETWDVLAPDVLHYISIRRANIRAVLSNFEAGLELYEGQDYLNAIPSFLNVVRLERDPENSYRKRARKLLDTARTTVFEQVASHRDKGSTAMKADDYELALREFRSALSASGDHPRIAETLRRDLSLEAERILRLVKSIMFNKEKLQYAQASAACDLLLDFLSPNSDRYNEALGRLDMLSKPEYLESLPRDPADYEFAESIWLLGEGTALTFRCSPVTDAGLEYLDGQTTLQLLDLSGTKVTDSGLVHLDDLTNLEDLELSKTKVGDAGLEHLEGLTKLETLDLSGTKVTDAGLKRLHGLAMLQRLGLGRTQVTDAGLVHLEGLTNLQELDLSGTQVTDAGLVHLKGLTKLTLLRLSYTQVSDAGLLQLKDLTNLEKLDLDGTKVTGAGIERVGEVTELTRLSLPSQFTDDDMVYLRKLTNLEDLELYGTKVTDAGLVHLGGMSGLENLFLYGPHFSDEGMRHLSGLTGLRWLMLDRSQVTIEGLQLLGGLTGLKTLLLLHLDHTKVTDADVTLLKQALPDCQILVTR